MIIEVAGTIIRLLKSPCSIKDAEQTAYFDLPRFGGDARAELPDGRFNANVLLALGFARAVQRGETGKCIVLAECSGYDRALAVVADPAGKTTSAALPLPERVEWVAHGHIVAFPGAVCGVFEREMDYPPDCDLVATYDRTAGCIIPCQIDPLTSTPRPLQSSALLSAAAAVICASEMRDGISERGVGNPGGTLEVGVRLEQGRVTGLSVGAPVRLIAY